MISLKENAEQSAEPCCSNTLSKPLSDEVIYFTCCQYRRLFCQAGPDHRVCSYSFKNPLKALKRARAIEVLVFVEPMTSHEDFDSSEVLQAGISIDGRGIE